METKEEKRERQIKALEKIIKIQAEQMKGNISYLNKLKTQGNIDE